MLILITPACSLIIFVDVPVYETYQSGEAWLKAMALCVPAGTLAGLVRIRNFWSRVVFEYAYIGRSATRWNSDENYSRSYLCCFIGKVFIKWYKEEQDNADEITQKALSGATKIIGAPIISQVGFKKRGN